jgi:hypothetical protein
MADAAEDLDLELPQGGNDLEGGAEARTPETADEDEVLIGFEGEGDAPPQGEDSDSNLVRHLREQLRERDRQLKALKVDSQSQKIEVGEKPTLAACDYDEARFEQELDAWKERDARAKAQEQEAIRTQQAQQEAWQKRLGELAVKKTELGVKDYDQAAEEVRTTFNELQQGMIIRAAKNPAKMIYALGKSPAKAAELAKITDPVDFIAEVARLEGKTTVQRKSAPPPEQTVRGSAPLSRVVDKEEKRLEAEAQKTGNRTELIRYRREKREAAQARR